MMSPTMLYPLRFHPLYKQYIWGGRKLETSLGKTLGPDGNYAESWEICDHSSDQSIVANGPLAGATLSELLARHGPELLGRHHPQARFPLLVKFLDARQTLSVQVHPNDAQAARLTPPDLGKTEAWVVLEAEPESLIYAGLKPGVGRRELEAAIHAGRLADCLHSFHPQPGDCVYIPAGTVHSLGAGLLVAEIQQSSDTTFRLFDWNRLGPDGKPRPLHVEQGLNAIDFRIGPINPRRPRAADYANVDCLAACDKFVIDYLTFGGELEIGGDGRFHILVVLEGSVRLEGDPSSAPLTRGSTALIPACVGPIGANPQNKAIALDVFLPDSGGF
jgi:mannose-6-phosphate isomerase